MDFFYLSEHVTNVTNPLPKGLVTLVAPLVLVLQIFFKNWTMVKKRDKIIYNTQKDIANVFQSHSMDSNCLFIT
jgi:hypothetical protein